MPQNPKLYVEGKNDVHVIGNLLKRHGLELDPNGIDPVKPILQPSVTPLGKEGGVENLVATMGSAIKVSEKSIGFVLDADPHVGVGKRWTAVRAQLKTVGVVTPDIIPPQGFIGSSTEYKISVGIWMMPDNLRDGTLETFLKDLIEENDSLIQHAIDSTKQAMSFDLRFSKLALPKAELYTWLAWQKEPGCPYGVAIARNYFRVDSPAAIAFVDWFRRLYDL